MTEMTRWDLEVSSSTDADVRAFLAEQGKTDRDLARFVEEAVRAELFDRSFDDHRMRNADLSEEEAMQLANEALAEVRDELWGPVRR